MVQFIPLAGAPFHNRCVPYAFSSVVDEDGNKDDDEAYSSGKQGLDKNRRLYKSALFGHAQDSDGGLFLVYTPPLVRLLRGELVKLASLPYPICIQSPQMKFSHEFDRLYHIIDDMHRRGGDAITSRHPSCFNPQTCHRLGLLPWARFKPLLGTPDDDTDEPHRRHCAQKRFYRAHLIDWAKFLSTIVGKCDEFDHLTTSVLRTTLSAASELLHPRAAAAPSDADKDETPSHQSAWDVFCVYMTFLDDWITRISVYTASLQERQDVVSQLDYSLVFCRTIVDKGVMSLLSDRVDLVLELLGAIILPLIFRTQPDEVHPGTQMYVVFQECLQTKESGAFPLSEKNES